MSALSSDPRDVGILAETQPLSLYAQLDVAGLQARAAWDRMSAAACEISIAKTTGHGLPAALAFYRSARGARLAALARISELRGAIARAERLAGRLVPGASSRPAAPELRAP